MLRDELNIPLQRKTLGKRLWDKRPSLLAMAYALTITTYGGAATWALQQELPFAGEPVVVSAIPKPVEVQEIVTASIDPATPEQVGPAGPETQPDPPEPSEAEMSAFDPPPAVPQADEGIEQVGGKPKAKIVFVKPVKQDTYKSDGNIILSARRALAPAPIDAISVKYADGVLPKIGPGNALPMNIYARRTPLSVVHSDAPKIAIILGGMGLNTKLSQRAIKELPADVTLAFAPYGDNLQAQVNAARKEGHEIFLQVPMEPMGFPAANPGPKTLLEESPNEENLNSLHWHMSRFAGYAGILNYMGGRYLKNPDSAKFVLTEMKNRGLYFVEDGSVQGSSSLDVATAIRAKAKAANRVIDANPTPEAIREALKELEAEAEQNGIAVGTGSVLGVTIDTISEWSKEAAERGIILVPVSASFRGRLG